MTRLNKTALFVCLKYSGTVHEIINTSFIVMLLKTYRKVKIYASPEMCLNIKNQLIELDVYSDDIQFVFMHFTRFKRGMMKTLVDAFRLLIISIRNIFPLSDIFFGTVNYSYVPIGNLISKFTKQRQFHLCHDELRFMFIEKPHKGYREWKSRIYAMTKIKYCHYFKFVVLGDSIKRNLKGKISDSAYKHMCCIIHPYYDISKHKSQNVTHNHIKVGIVGEIRTDELFQNTILFNKILEEYDNIYLHLVSKNRNYDFSNCSRIISDNPNNRHLLRDEYDMLVQDLDYIYFPYTKESYKYGASGAVYEAIVKGIPFIAYSNDYFKMLNDKFGKIGFLYETEEEMRLLIEKIHDGKLDYDRKNAENVKQYLDPRNYYIEFQKNLYLI